MKSGIFSAEENQFIIENYQGMTQAEIGNHLNRKEASIKDRIKKLGLSKIPKIAWTEEEVVTLKRVWHRENDYMRHFPHRTTQSVGYKAWELGLKRDGRGNFTVNHDYFKKMDANRAYIIGLIAADGNLYMERHRTTITLHKNDRALLEKIKEELGSERNLSLRKTGACDLVLTSREIASDLQSFGLTDAKSLTLGKLKIPKEYMSHFVRGYFDGDGSVSTYVRRDEKKERTVLEASFLGTKAFLSWLNEEASKQAPLPVLKVHKTSSNIQKIKYTGKSALKLADWMYQDSTLFLERKKARFDSYRADISSNPKG